MIEKLKSHKLLVALGAVLIIGALYFIMNGSGGSSNTSLLGTSSLPASANGSATVGGVDQELQSTLAKVRAISLNDPIMTDPAFLGLHDINQQIVSEPSGRPNPFAPIGSDAGAATTTTSGN